MAKYDVVIVGAGPAGGATALRCAQAGLKTILLERGNYPGEKHLEIVGLWKPFLDELIPNVDELIPKEKLLWNFYGFNTGFEYGLTKKGGFFTCKALQLDEPDDPNQHGIAVLYRNQWDKWFAEEICVPAGVELKNKANVVDVIRDGNGAIVGVVCDNGEKFEAPIVVAADGTNSPTARAAGLRDVYQACDVFVYAQIKYKLLDGAPPQPPGIVGTYDFIETEYVDVSEVAPGNTWTYFLTEKDGQRYFEIGGGGTVYPGSHLGYHVRTNIWYLLQRICKHPMYSEYVKHGELVSFDVSLVPAVGDLGKPGPTYGDGVMAVGDAGIGTVWQGFGVFPAWQAGIAAAAVAKKAIDKGDASAAVLQEYEEKWKAYPWYGDAYAERYIHGLWGKENGLYPLLAGLHRITPECDVRPGYGYVQAHADFLKDVIYPTLANAANMWPIGTVPMDLPDPEDLPLPSAKVGEEESEWVGKKLSDKIKALTDFIPSKTEFIKVKASKCTGCGLCYRHCMGGVFDMDEKTGKAVVARLETCVECGLCQHVCPADAIDWSYPEGGTGLVCESPGAYLWDDPRSEPLDGGRPTLKKVSED
jgi:electron transfer flavoprotein-quinone oxidoreductase